MYVEKKTKFKRIFCSSERYGKLIPDMIVIKRLCFSKLMGRIRFLRMRLKFKVAKNRNNTRAGLKLPSEFQENKKSIYRALDLRWPTTIGKIREKFPKGA